MFFKKIFSEFVEILTVWDFEFRDSVEYPDIYHYVYCHIFVVILMKFSMNDAKFWIVCGFCRARVANPNWSQGSIQKLTKK
jgi:hypothetical protein